MSGTAGVSGDRSQPRPLQIGLFLPSVAGFMDGATARWSDLLAMAEHAAAVGFDALWLADHFWYLGGEIRDPGRVIPRAILLSIAGVACLYLTMNISILGAMPWQEVEQSRFIASDFMARIWGPRIGAVVTIMMLWTAFASVFSLLLGYSRVPYAAALEGDYFKIFARMHPKHHFPHVSLLWLGSAAAIFCLFKLADVVTALVVIRISIQFLAQTLGVMVLRQRRPDLPRPFRMWLYPVPAILAFIGFVYVIVMRPKSLEAIRISILVAVVGSVLFWVRRR